MVATLHPIKRSPVHHKLAESGAVLAEVSGWFLAEHFGDAQAEAEAARASIGFCDLSSTAKCEVKGADVSEYLGSILGGPPPLPGRSALVGSGYVCRISRYHAIFIFDPEDAAFAARIREASSHFPCAHVTDRSSGLGCFFLCGPQACAVLRKLTPLDLRPAVFPDFSCAYTPMAAIRVLVARRDRWRLPGYEIFFSREYGEYFWDVLREAGEEFQMRPFGLLAARLLEH